MSEKHILPPVKALCVFLGLFALTTPLKQFTASVLVYFFSHET